MRATVTLLEGPNLIAPFAAVMVEAECPTRALPLDAAEAGLQKLVPAILRDHLRSPLADGRYETVARAVAEAIETYFGDPEPRSRAERVAADRCRILLGYLDPNAATLTLRASLDATDAIFAQAAGTVVERTEVSARLQGSIDQLFVWQPDPIASSLIRAARRRGIPVCPTAPGSRVWMLGHGARAIQFFEAANHADSAIGARIARNKFMSNQLVTRLGFPGVRHGMAADPRVAFRLAREIGYPLVVKPVASGKGAGVTAYITDDVQLATAFGEANRISPGGVLVERHVVGLDHRIVVVGGKFAWAVCRTPATVVADGLHSIVELMQIENRRRGDSATPDIGPAALEIDAEVHSVLAAQKLVLDDRPAARTHVRLRHIANTARGGTIADCSADVHPDVRDMAEAIARAFHLDVMGLDLMTPDVSRSWRDVDCAVLEVNATPGFSSDARADLILEKKFPDGDDGRIPTAVLVDASRAAFDAVVKIAEQLGHRVGATRGDATSLSGSARRLHANASASARAAALLLDPACDALVVATTVTEIERRGMPLTHCDVALTGAQLGASMHGLLDACSDARYAIDEAGRLDPIAAVALRAAFARRRNQ